MLRKGTVLNIRGWLAIGAAVAATSWALAAPAVASATAAAPTAHSATAAPTRSAAHGAVVVPGLIGGVVPALGAQPPVTPEVEPAASCREPNCDVSYHGGPVQTRPHLYVVFWGPTWRTNKTEKTVARYVTAFYEGIGEPRDNWVKTLDQYHGKSGHPAFGYELLAGVYFDTNKPQRSVTFADLAAEARKTAAHFRARNTPDVDVVVAAQSGTCFAKISGAVFVGNCGKQPSTPPRGAYCGWHSATDYGSSYLGFIDLPYMLNAPRFCPKNFVNRSGSFDAFSLVGGHEFAESVTDPVPGPGWYGWIDLHDNVSGGGEIADKCQWRGETWRQSPPDPAGDISLATGRFAVQSLWSNAARKCVM
jgi:hypothetical protein